VLSAPAAVQEVCVCRVIHAMLPLLLCACLLFLLNDKLNQFLCLGSDKQRNKGYFLFSTPIVQLQGVLKSLENNYSALLGTPCTYFNY
jgi:hypothetical protein